MLRRTNKYTRGSEMAARGPNAGCEPFLFDPQNALIKKPVQMT